GKVRPPSVIGWKSDEVMKRTPAGDAYLGEGTGTHQTRGGETLVWPNRRPDCMNAGSRLRHGAGTRSS
ncbi:hypothetical protein, partial [Mesorhizobium sp. M1D.F.Ca.ET.184.01.1.1]|uniref:hypothetical protein n=1 Tax=Mesorhizobium sp. M1D.F.Ca.ET.184.01.1.1 TaxID=2563931 RepID=UPI001AEF2171